MIISLNELVSQQVITEDSSGRKVFKETFSTKEILVNTDNIVTVREADRALQERIKESGFIGAAFSSVYLNRGGVNSTEVLVLETPNEIKRRLNQKVLLND